MTIHIPELLETGCPFAILGALQCKHPFTTRYNHDGNHRDNSDGHGDVDKSSSGDYTGSDDNDAAMVVLVTRLMGFQL